jgi:hypothetical protein
VVAAVSAMVLMLERSQLTCHGPRSARRQPRRVSRRRFAALRVWYDGRTHAVQVFLPCDKFRKTTRILSTKFGIDFLLGSRANAAAIAGFFQKPVYEKSTNRCGVFTDVVLALP